jgi:hypothetical protein
MIRPASVGDIATMTRRLRATSPPGQCTVALSAACSISWTGASSTIRSPTSAASRFGISLVPPMNRVVCAPPSDSANSSDVTPQVWMVNSRCRKDTSAVGTARIPTVQISSSVRATGESPCASYQAPAVTASHSRARGACQGASTGTSAANKSRWRSTNSSYFNSAANRA